MNLSVRVAPFWLMVAALAWAQPQASLPAAQGLSDLSTPTSTINFLYQTKERAVALLRTPTPLAFSALRDLGNRGVELYLVCPAGYANTCRSLPGVAGLVITQTAPQPLWILDGASFLISPYLDTGFDEGRSFALTSKTAAQMFEEVLGAFFAAP